MNSDLKERGGFTCSDPTVNTLQELTRRSDLANFYYFPTDCPQREKNGWTADAALSSEHLLLNLSPETSYREWMRNICKAMDDRGALPASYPPAGGASTGATARPGTTCFYICPISCTCTGATKRSWRKAPRPSCGICTT